MQKPISIMSIVVSLCLVIASGCSLKPTDKLLQPGGTEFSSVIVQPRTHEDSEKLVALDLVGALAQIREMNPSQVFLTVNDPSSSFDVRVQSALDSAGYRQQSENPSLRSLTVETTVAAISDLTPVASKDSATSVKTFQIKIRNITLTRDYLFDGERIEPRSRMRITGANAIRVRLDNTLFDTPVEHHAKAEQHDLAPPLPADGAVLNTPMQTDLPPAGANDQLPDSWTDPGSALPLVVRAKSEVGSILSGGDPIQITVEAAQDSRIHCYYEDSAGTVTRLFPNRYRKDSMIYAGEILVLPESNQWQLLAPLAGKTDHVMCIALAPEENNTKPLLPDLLPIVATSFSEIKKRYKAAAGTELVTSEISIAAN